jgi:hypothetical protein
MDGGHVGIRINDQVGPNFQTRKGDPLSPILFNIVVSHTVLRPKLNVYLYVCQDQVSHIK